VAIFHLSVKIISRSKGQSAIASAAYRSGQRLVDQETHVHIMLTMRSIKTTGEWASKQKSGYILDENGHKVPQIDPKTHELDQVRRSKMWQFFTYQSK